MRVRSIITFTVLIQMLMIACIERCEGVIWRHGDRPRRKNRKCHYIFSKALRRAVGLGLLTSQLCVYIAFRVMLNGMTKVATPLLASSLSLGRPMSFLTQNTCSGCFFLKTFCVGFAMA